MPGDAIVGVVRTGRGITIHRSECATLARRSRATPSAGSISGWKSGVAGSKAIARLQVMTLNQPGSLGSLSAR